jgi:hypothetical protein
MTHNDYPDSGTLYESQIPNGIRIEIYIPDGTLRNDLLDALQRASERLLPATTLTDEQRRAGGIALDALLEAVDVTEAMNIYERELGA